MPITMKNNKPTIFNGLKYLAIALPFLFFAPIVITIGFKALKKGHTFLWLLLGIILAIAAMTITAIGILKISNYLFEKDNEKD